VRRDLERGQPSRGERPEAVSARRARPGQADDDGELLAERGVGQAERGDLGDVGVVPQAGLDLAAADVLAASGDFQ
jgi:hypothetical protein